MFPRMRGAIGLPWRQAIQWSPVQTRAVRPRKWAPARESRGANCLSYQPDRRRTRNVRSWEYLPSTADETFAVDRVSLVHIGVRWAQSAMLGDQDRPLLLELVLIRLQRSICRQVHSKNTRPVIR